MKKTMIGATKIVLAMTLAAAFVSPLAADTWTRRDAGFSGFDWSDGTAWTNDTGTANTAPNQIGAIVLLPNANAARSIVLSSMQTLGVFTQNSTISGWSVDGTGAANAILNFNNGTAIASQINLLGSTMPGFKNVDVRLNGDLIVTSSNSLRSDSIVILDAGSVTSGVGNMVIKNYNLDTTGTARQIIFSNTFNHTGWIINEGSTARVSLGNSGVTGIVGSNVKGIKQNSANAEMTFSSTAALQNFTGEILVQTGTLRFALTGGVTVSALNMSKLTVAAGGVLYMDQSNLSIGSATLTGDGLIFARGTVARTVYLTSGGHIAPGTGSTGTLLVDGNVNVVAGVNFDYIVGATTGLLDVTGALTLPGTAGSVFLNINLDSGVTVGDYDLIHFGSLTGATTANMTGRFIVDFNVAGMVAGTDYSLNVDTGRNMMYLTLTTIPEPSTWLLLGGGAALLAVLRLRRKNS